MLFDPGRFGRHATLLLVASLLIVGVAPAAAPGTGSLAHVSPSFKVLSSSDTRAAGASLTPTSPRPAAITLSVAGVTPAALGLTWGATNDFTFSHYTVYESPNGSTGSFSAVATITTQSASDYSTASLTPGSTSYWYVVEQGLFSQTSNTVTATQPSLSYLNYTRPGPASATFNWTNNASYGGPVGFVEYALYERTQGGAPSLVATVANPATKTYTASGLTGGISYSFYLNTTDCYSGCGTSGVLYSTTQSNVVGFGTVLPLQASVSALRPVVDVGQSDQFICSPVGGVTPYTFAWNYGNGTFVPGPGSVGASFGSAGPAQVTCRVTDKNGTQARGATSLSVNPDPVLIASTSARSLDAGTALIFSCWGSGGTPPIALGWAFGDGDQNFLGNLSYTYHSAGKYTAVCTGTDTTGTQVAASIPLNVSPPFSLTSTVSSSSSAPGTALIFSAHPANGSGSYPTVRWSTGDGFTSPSAQFTHAYRTAGMFAVNVTVVDSNGGNATNHLSVTVSSITATVSLSSQSVRTSQSIRFSANASGGAGGPFNYSWSFGDGHSAYGATVTHAYSAAGTEHPTLTVTDRLGASTQVAASPVAVSTPPAPPPLVPWWVIALVIGLAVLALAILLYRRSRVRRSEALEAAMPWAPPTDPKSTVLGMKRCPSCGAANVPVRKTCSACGKDLPRG